MYQFSCNLLSDFVKDTALNPVLFAENKCFIEKNGTIIVQGQQMKDLYTIQTI